MQIDAAAPRLPPADWHTTIKTSICSRIKRKRLENAFKLPERIILLFVAFNSAGPHPFFNIVIVAIIITLSSRPLLAELIKSSEAKLRNKIRLKFPDAIA